MFYERKNLTAIVRASENTVLPSVSSLANKSKDTEINSLSDLSSENNLASEDYSLPPGYGYMLQYTTFIPFDYAPNPWCDVVCSDYKYFGGDGLNRGFDFFSGRFRTRSEVYLTWDGADKYAKLFPQIGVTRGYDENYQPVRSDQAPFSDIQMLDVEFTSNYTYHRMELASGNPLTPSPDINAYYLASVTPNGSGHFYGVHDKAPSHEFYISVYQSDFYAPIHQHTHSGFDYLWPYKPNEEFDVNLY